MHAVAMKIGAIASAAGGNALRKHLYDSVEIGARQIAVRISAAHKCEQFIFAPGIVIRSGFKSSFSEGQGG